MDKKAEAVKRIEVMLNEQKVDFEVAVQFMDDELREEVHSDFAPCSEQEFMNEYAKRHLKKFHEVFEVN